MRSLICILLGGVITLSSCVKKEVTPLTDEGKTFVKILQADLNQLYFSPFSEIRQVSLFSIRRDANASANLEVATPLVMTRVDGLVTRYNAQNGTNYEQLPDSLYTLDPSITKSGSIWNMTLNSGQFAKDFFISLNGAKWNLSKKYALGFALTSAGNFSKASGKDSILVTLSIKNQWDGKYTLRCGFYHPSYAPNIAKFSQPVELHTSGVNKVKIYWSGGYLQPCFDASTGAPDDYFYFGSQTPEITINETTNAVSVQNVFTGATTFYTMGLGFNNLGHRQSYDPADKSILTHWGYYMDGGVFTPGLSRAWADSFYYVGPR